jgi:hypothetical protein
VRGTRQGVEDQRLGDVRFQPAGQLGIFARHDRQNLSD